MSETRTVHFSISGEFITDQARQFWSEFQFKKAFDLLDCMIGMTKEQQISILAGKNKLVGVNDLDMIEDDWTPPEGYCSFEDALTYGENYPELQQRRREDARGLLSRAYQLRTSYRGSGDDAYEADLCQKQAIDLIGEEEALNYLEEVKAREDFRGVIRSFQQDEYFTTPKARPEPLDPYQMAVNNLRNNAIMQGLDVSMLPSVEALKNRGVDLVAVLDSKMESASGWLLPDGKYYGCSCMEHIGLAGVLLEEKHPKLVEDGNAEYIAEKYGWIKISTAIMGTLVFGHKPATKKQLTKLWDYAQLHNHDYEKLIQHLPDGSI